MKYYGTTKSKLPGSRPTFSPYVRIHNDDTTNCLSLYPQSCSKRSRISCNDVMNFCHYEAAYTSAYSEDDSRYEYSRLNKVSMSEAIQMRRYDLVRSNLSQKRFSDDPNEEIRISQVYMTGLEYSVYTSDWKMAILFFVQSADPSYNCFDGTIVEVEQNESLMVQAICRTHPAFMLDFAPDGKRRQISPISGFKGLYCLLPSSPEDSAKVTRCSLWLMEKSYHRHFPLATPNNIMFARYCLLQIGAKTVWNNEFTYKVFITLMSIHRVGLRIDNGQIGNDIALNILEFVLDDILLDAVWEGLRYASDCAANP